MRDPIDSPIQSKFSHLLITARYGISLARRPTAGEPTKISEGNPLFIAGQDAAKIVGPPTKSSGIHEVSALQKGRYLSSPTSLKFSTIPQICSRNVVNMRLYLIRHAESVANVAEL